MARYLALLGLLLVLTACPGPTPPLSTEPEIGGFGAVPPTIEAGGKSLLSWSVSRAETLVVTPGDIDVSGKASLVVSPTTTTTYTLTARNMAGWIVRDTTVTVLPADGLSIPQSVHRVPPRDGQL